MEEKERWSDYFKKYYFIECVCLGIWRQIYLRKKKHKTFLKSELIAHMLIKRKQGRVNREVRKMTSCRRWLRGYWCLDNIEETFGFNVLVIGKKYLWFMKVVEFKPWASPVQKHAVFNWVFLVHEIWVHFKKIITFASV